MLAMLHVITSSCMSASHYMNFSRRRLWEIHLENYKGKEGHRYGDELITDNPVHIVRTVQRLEATLLLGVIPQQAYENMG